MVTGFLGSGKTTVLNDALAALAGRRVAVLVNEWGKTGVDGALLRDPAGFGITELAGGQIFCACVAPAFMKAIERLVEMGSELILVETSGLAKPSTLATLVAEVRRRTGGALRYAGLACVVDATRFSTLRAVALVVDEQVAYADRFFIAKADLADAAETAAIRAVLLAARPGAPVVLRSGKPVGPEALLGSAADPYFHADIPASDPRWAGWGAEGRPKSVTLFPSGRVGRDGLSAFLGSVAGLTFRIKGFVALEGEGRTLVDCVGDSIAFRPFQAEGDAARAGTAQMALTLIWNGRGLPGRSIPAADLAAGWERTTGTTAKIIE